MAPTLVEHVVADAGAFLKKVPLQVRFWAVFQSAEAFGDAASRPLARSSVFLLSASKDPKLLVTEASAPHGQQPVC